MYRANGHPIRKCGKCKLNFRTHCGLFDSPHTMWDKHRKCPGYMSEDHYREYLALQDKAAAKRRSKPSVLARREDAKRRRTEPHHDGTHLNKPT